MAEHADRLTLHSSWRGIAGVYAGASIVLAIGVVAVVGGGWRVFSVVMLAVGLLLTLGAGADFPIASTFTAEGVHRHTLLRRQYLPWNKVTQLSRSRTGIVAGMRKTTLGGMVAAVGRRKYLLVDQGESGPEFDRLVSVVGGRQEELRLDVLSRPADDAAPTWLYRKARWAPDGVKRR
jgi:hypothetical protein